MDKSNEKYYRISIILAVISAGVLLISNIVATKLWSFFSIPVDGGILIFPVSYIIGDLTVEILGRKRADYILYVSFFLNVFAVLIFMAVGALPPYKDWGGQEAYMTILGFTPRLIFGSLVAYISSGLLNNIVFQKIKAKTGEKKLALRALGSSFVAKFCDILIFETVAFLGVLPLSEFFVQAGFAYIAGIALEIILTPLTIFSVNKIKAYLK